MLTCCLVGTQATSRRQSPAVQLPCGSWRLQPCIRLSCVLTHALHGLHVCPCVLLLLLQDIIRVRRAEGSLRTPVADHMTSPALTVGPKVSVRQAAKIMLQHKIRRLPVVDRNGHALG